MQRGTMVASIMEMNLWWATCDGHLKALVSCSCNCFRLVICLSRARPRLQKLADCSVIAQSNTNFLRQTGVNLLVGRAYAYNKHAYTTQDWAYSHAWQNAVLGSHLLIYNGWVQQTQFSVQHGATASSSQVHGAAVGLWVHNVYRYPITHPYYCVQMLGRRFRLCCAA
jgi:hypothetical protein